MQSELDRHDRAILRVLSAEGRIPVTELARRIGLSKSPTQARLKRLEDSGLITGTRLVLDRELLGLELTVFMMIRTRHHARDWSARFRRHVEAIPEVSEFHRIGGDWDYLIRIVTRSMGGYDQVYQTLIGSFELESVTGYFSMETIFEGRPLVLYPGVLGDR